MADAIENLAQDLSALYPLGYENYAGPRPSDFGVPQQPDSYGYQWQWDASSPNWGYFEAPASNIDFNIRDQPVERINIGTGGEENAFVRGGIGSTLNPITEDRYGVKGLISPDKVGGTIGVVDVNPGDFAGQTPSVPQGVISGGGTVGRTFEEFTNKPDYSVPIGFMDNGDIIMANRYNNRDTIVVPSGRSISEADIEKGVKPNLSIPESFGGGKKESASQPMPFGSSQQQPSTGGFENTGDFTGIPETGTSPYTGPSSSSWNATPDWKEEVKPTTGDVAPPFTTATPESIKEINLRRQGWKIDEDGNYYTWNPFDKATQERYGIYGNWVLATDPRITTPTEEETKGGGGTTKPPTGETGGTTTKPPGTGSGTGGGTGSTGGTGTGGGTRPGTGGTGGTGGGGTGGGAGGAGSGGTGGGGLFGDIGFGGNQATIPSKPLRTIPIPDRQADPFEKLYNDLLANAQQQKDQYRYINYDPDQIMNAAMRSFRSRGAMRSLQG